MTETRKPRIVVCVPTGSGRPYHQSATSVIQAVVEFSAFANTTMHWLPGALVYNARRILIEQAIKEDADYVFFLDDDMLLGDGSMRPLYDGLRNSPYTAISGLACMRNLHTRLCVSWTHPEGMMDWDAFPGEGRLEANPVWPVNGFGMACVLIDLKKLKKNLGHLNPDGDEWDPSDDWQNPFLPMKITNPKNGKHELMGEDLSFCRRIREGGGKLAIHYYIRPGHFITAPLMFDDFLAERAFQKRKAELEAKNRPKLIVP